MKKYLNKKILIIIIIFVVFAISLLGIFLNNGSIHTKGIKVYYRTYTKEKGWTSWKKNGQVSGDKKHNILAVEMKVKSKSRGYIFYNVYQKDWIENDCYDEVVCGNTKSKNGITSFRVMLSDNLYKKYNTSYKVYTNKWYEYEKDYNIIPNINYKESITAIQLKIEERNKK
jgi:hypothetical protein